ALMGIALWLVWRKQPSRQPYVLFAIQLALNALWSFLFFGLQSPILGLAEIAILWIVIALTLRSFYKVSRPAGLLLLPYIAWVTIALALNLSIFLLNA
ncbi:MAG: tryptophan-rich sensory protein, partial [Candidatus Aenigmarchaeota archaeon]|nr:tryptophan-rich sensory protein [Candidatus Aenigmarchaeota archaeon]